MAINEEYLYILKRNSSGRFIAKAFPIYKKEEFYAFPKDTKKEDYPRIIQRRLGLRNEQYFNYTDGISSSYVDVANFEIEKFNDGKKWAKNYLDAYYIEQAYVKCILDSQIKAYSHRKIGWKLHNFILDEVFSIAVNTNFGYGYANYFLLILKFKDVEIIPYSHLVIYRIANVMEIIRNTRNYSIRDESWQECFDFISEVCNDFYEKGQDGFVRKYMLDELEKMTNELSHFLSRNTFDLRNFHDRNKSWEKQLAQTFNLSGYSLTIFRGEKISGAVKFVDSIKQLSEIIPTKKYLSRIANCCYQVIPEIILALNKLEFEIPDALKIKENEHKNLLKLKYILNKSKNTKEKQDKKIERWLLKLEENNSREYKYIVAIKDKMLSRYRNKLNINSNYMFYTNKIDNKILNKTCMKWIESCANYHRLKRRYTRQEEIYRKSNNKWSSLHNFKITLVSYSKIIDGYLEK
jgi:hypothetical protein